MNLSVITVAFSALFTALLVNENELIKVIFYRDSFDCAATICKKDVVCRTFPFLLSGACGVYSILG